MELLDLLTIGIKTFNRPECLNNCLMHIFLLSLYISNITLFLLKNPLSVE